MALDIPVLENVNTSLQIILLSIDDLVNAEGAFSESRLNMFQINLIVFAISSF
jgi:hypothetical protein